MICLQAHTLRWLLEAPIVDHPVDTKPTRLLMSVDTCRASPAPGYSPAVLRPGGDVAWPPNTRQCPSVSSSLIWYFLPHRSVRLLMAPENLARVSNFCGGTYIRVCCLPLVMVVGAMDFGYNYDCATP